MIIISSQDALICSLYVTLCHRVCSAPWPASMHPQSTGSATFRLGCSLLDNNGSSKSPISVHTVMQSFSSFSVLDANCLAALGRHVLVQKLQRNTMDPNGSKRHLAKAAKDGIRVPGCPSCFPTDTIRRRHCQVTPPDGPPSPGPPQLPADRGPPARGAGSSAPHQSGG